MTSSVIRHDWQAAEVLDLYALPFNDLLFKAQTIHRDNKDGVQFSHLSLR